MDDARKNLEGSPNRDAFKKWHKKLDGRLYCFDADLFFFEKNPNRIPALVDYKTRYDRWKGLSFTEVGGYNCLLAKGIPVYIVTSDPPFEQLLVEKYLGGDPAPNPPIFRLRTVAIIDPAQYETWERGIRGC